MIDLCKNETPLKDQPDYYIMSQVITQVLRRLCGEKISYARDFLVKFLEQSMVSDYSIIVEPRNLEVKFALHGNFLYLTVSVISEDCDILARG